MALEQHRRETSFDFVLSTEFSLEEQRLTQICLGIHTLSASNVMRRGPNLVGVPHGSLFQRLAPIESVSGQVGNRLNVANLEEAASREEVNSTV